MNINNITKTKTHIKETSKRLEGKIQDIAKLKTKQHTLPQVDTEKYQKRDGLEGPIQTKSGKTVYYDPKKGKYYDPDTDIYLSHDEWKQLSEDQGQADRYHNETLGLLIKKLKSIIDGASTSPVAPHQAIAPSHFKATLDFVIDELESLKLLFPNKAYKSETVNEEHEIGLLKAVAQQMEADAHAGDYTAIEELLQDVSEEELKGFLSDHRSPNEWPEEAVNEDREDCTACNGTGWERVSSDEDERACDDCSGTGKVDEALISEEEVTVDNEGNIAGYLDTIDEYVAMLFKGKELPLAHKNEVAYRIQAAVDDIRTRELGLKPSNVRSQYNEDDDDGATTQDLQDIIAHRIGTNQKLLLRLIDNPEGIEGLNDAIEDVASWFSGTTEVGSSDVSEMVKAVMKNLGHINDPFNAHMNGDDQISDSTLQKSGKNIVKELRMRAESSRKN